MCTFPATGPVLTRPRSGRGDVPDSPSPEAADERDLDLADAVAKLPDKQRQAVAYHYLAGLRYAQVGELLGTNEAAARRAAADGIARLRRSYPVPDDSDAHPRSFA